MGGDSAFPLGPSEATLFSVLVSTVQERQGHTGEGLSEATEMMRSLEHLCYKERLTAGPV